ncbi:uncharacterized protein FIBRA_04760 [Fibroporia radiculosa]|uniref:Semialdehyde dehydrogenase NAD-binding domain-containing protein n=1 Tax=Fibroporia radiculosa TaxID=599839 RepID=J4IAC2_9APHY|nr:uncharacterized protein FIBRA_04760 [Fibroporia radiculosa]CCM02656.1 predicted protein [Fibroporia radiculosa]
MTGLNALILGATGATGKHLLQELLASPQYANVSEYGRRVTPAERITAGKGKLEQKVIDFEKLDEAELKDKRWDVVFITLGTTHKQAGSAAAFEKIDREYVVNAARAAKSDDPNHPQRLLYLSSIGADPAASSLYPKSKGLTERELAKLGYNDTVIFRPAVLGTEREDSRPLEHVAQGVSRLLSTFSSRIYMPVPTLAKVMRDVGAVGSAKLPSGTVQQMGDSATPFSCLNNSAILAIADSFS